MSVPGLSKILLTVSRRTAWRVAGLGPDHQINCPESPRTAAHFPVLKDFEELPVNGVEEDENDDANGDSESRTLLKIEVQIGVIAEIMYTFRHDDCRHR